MKKISFGSFPFINIDKKTRMCLDKYLIKTFADQIIVTDMFKNLNTAKNYYYLTPSIIIDQLFDFSKNQIRLNVKNKFVKTRGVIMDNECVIKFKDSKVVYPDKKIIIEEAEYANELKPVDKYMDILKRAFFILRKFYEKASKDPFYRDTVYLPIYSEKLTSLNPRDPSRSEFKYSIFILTNDLLKDLKLDEVSFNDAAVVNTLYLFTQLFPHKALTDFNEKDLDKIVKLYTFFDKVNLTPIKFFITFYRLAYIIYNIKNINDLEKEIQKIKSDPQLSNVISDDFILALFKYLKSKRDGIAILVDLKNLFYKRIYASDIFFSRKTLKDFSKGMWNLIDLILKDNNIVSLFKDIGNNTRERYHILNERVKYKDIILLFEELVKFNKKGFNDIVKDLNYELDFKVEINNNLIAFNEQVIIDKLNETFANFLQDANGFIEKLIEKKVQSISGSVDKYIKLAANSESEMRNIQNQLTRINREIMDLQSKQASLNSLDPMDAIEKNKINEEIAQLEKHKISLEMKLSSFVNFNNSMINSQNSTYREIDNENVQFMLSALDEKLNKLNEKLTELEKAGLNNLESYTKLKAQRDALEQQKSHMLSLQSKTDLNVPYNNYEDSFKNLTLNAANLSITLEKAKTELGELYQALKNLFTDEELLTIFLNNDITSATKFKSLIEEYERKSPDSLSENERAFRNALIDIHISLLDIADVLYQNIKAEVEAQLINSENLFGATDISIIEKIKNTLVRKLEDSRLKEEIYDKLLGFLCLRVCRIIKNIFRKINHTKQLTFQETVAGLHPILKKMLKNPNYFKSFIFGFDMLVSLYDLWYLTEMEKFLAGVAFSEEKGINLVSKPPVKFNRLTNKIDFVINDLLKLENNPIWIIAKNKIYLSLPDYMSLTHQRLFSSIPKEEIQNYCVFDYQKLWTEKDMGRLFNTPQDYKKIVRQIKDVEKDLTQKEKELEGLLKTKKDLQKKGKRLDDKKYKRLKQLQKETSILRETLKYLKAQLALLDPYEYVKFNSLPSIEV